MSKFNTRAAKPAAPSKPAPAMYSATQVEAIVAKSEAAHCKIFSALHETIDSFKEIMAKQDHQLMQFRGLCALARATGQV